MKKDAFRKTESTLYAFYKNGTIIDEKKSYIQELKKFGLHKRSGSVIGTPNGAIKRDDSDIIDELIEKTETEITELQLSSLRINSVIKSLSNIECHEMIDLKYNQNKSFDDIADILHVSRTTIYSKRKELIEIIWMHLFSTEYNQELLKMND